MVIFCPHAVVRHMVTVVVVVKNSDKELCASWGRSGEVDIVLLSKPTREIVMSRPEREDEELGGSAQG